MFTRSIYRMLDPINVIIALVIICIAIFTQVTDTIMKHYGFTGGYNRKYSKQDIEQCLSRINKHNDLDKIFEKSLSPITKLSEIDGSLAYCNTDCMNYVTTHNGQLKLLISEIQFCTAYTCAQTNATPRANVDTKHLIVYAGSAPHFKGAILTELFPNTVWLLIDPAEHLILYDNKDDKRLSSTNKSSTPGYYDATHYNTSSLTQAEREYEIHTVYLCAAKGNRFNISSRKIHILIGNTTEYIDRDDERVATASIGWMTNEYLPTFLNSISKYKHIIVEDYMSDNVANMLREFSPLFICDIRTNMSDADSGLFNSTAPSDLDVTWNNAMVLGWVRIMKPHASMLKMRHPYFAKKEKSLFKSKSRQSQYATTFDKIKDVVDFEDDYEHGKISYIDGEEYLQAYAGPTSGETRIVFEGEPKLVNIDYIARENKLFYYNLIRRQFGCSNTHINEDIGLDMCGDCAIFYNTIAEYCAVTDQGDRIDELIKHILRVTLGIKTKYHGHQFKKHNDIADIVNVLI